MDINSVTNAVKSVTDFDARKQRWADWMQKPENRTFMLQTGISLLQSPVPGQTTLGAIGTAIGQGAAARDRNIQSGIDQKATAQDRQYKADTMQMNKEELGLKRQELQSKIANDKSLSEYRKNLGLSAILRAQRPGGKAPPTMDELWNKYWSNYQLNRGLLGETVTEQDKQAQYDLFMQDPQTALQSVGAADTGNTPPPDTSMTTGSATSTATDPKTGRKAILRDNTWVDAQTGQPIQ